MVDTNRVQSIVAGIDPQFDQVIVAGKASLPELFQTPYRVVQKQTFARHGHDGTLCLVEKAGDAAADPKAEPLRGAP